MSTPTTATATLPPHYRHPHNHSHYPPFLQSNAHSASYRAPAVPSAAPANPILPTPNPNTSSVPASTASNRHAPASPYTPTLDYSTATNAGSQPFCRTSTTNGAPAPSVTSAARQTQDYTRTVSASTPRSDANHRINMPSSVASTQPQSHDAGAYARKRRRSKEPDWDNFYRNGLPKEIIVIDDTPEPEVDVKDAALSHSTRTYTNGTANGSEGPGHVAKKRRKEDVYQHSSARTATANGSHVGSPSSASTSTDRTTSAYATTAPTSLGSLSSNGHHEYDAPQTGQKRKRTRQQIAQEAKRREVEILNETYESYRPPAKPVKKSNEVAVRVVNDVSSKAQAHVRIVV